MDEREEKAYVCIPRTSAVVIRHANGADKRHTLLSLSGSFRIQVGQPGTASSRLLGTIARCSSSGIWQ